MMSLIIAFPSLEALLTNWRATNRTGDLETARYTLNATFDYFGVSAAHNHYHNASKHPYRALTETYALEP
jgi:hypothetical protein